MAERTTNSVMGKECVGNPAIVRTGLNAEQMAEVQRVNSRYTIPDSRDIS